jgi:TM2 domain-containing membrane protein YozV
MSNKADEMNATTSGHMVFCRACGKQIHDSAPTCPGCGAIQSLYASATIKRILPAALLCFFLGFFGAHRFYVGKVGTAIVEFITLGGFGIWVLVDFIMIIVGGFTDKDGNKLTQWT